MTADMESASSDVLHLPQAGRVQMVVSARARCLRLIVRSEKTIEAILPVGYPRHKAVAFIQSKEGWIQKQLHKLKTCMPQEQVGSSDIELLHKKADFLAVRLAQLAQRIGLAYSGVRIGFQKTKWGSCNGQNRIILNVATAFLPAHLRDYVLLHELVHIQVKNHSPRFWMALDQHVDGLSRTLAKELRRYRPAMPAD